MQGVLHMPSYPMRHGCVAYDKGCKHQGVLNQPWLVNHGGFVGCRACYMPHTHMGYTTSLQGLNQPHTNQMMPERCLDVGHVVQPYVHNVGAVFYMVWTL